MTDRHDPDVSDTEQPVADDDAPKTFNDAIKMASALKMFCLNKGLDMWRIAATI